VQIVTQKYIPASCSLCEKLQSEKRGELLETLIGQSAAKLTYVRRFRDYPQGVVLIDWNEAPRILKGYAADDDIVHPLK
jgi:hypothetical protein